MPSGVIRISFHPCTPGRKINFSPDMPVRQGPRLMPARCAHVHGDAGDNTDDPGAMIRDDPWCDP